MAKIFDSSDDEMDVTPVQNGTTDQNEVEMEHGNKKNI